MPTKISKKENEQKTAGDKQLLGDSQNAVEKRHEDFLPDSTSDASISWYYHHDLVLYSGHNFRDIPPNFMQYTQEFEVIAFLKI